jgi:lysophospholipase L1-like esterase
MNKTVANDTLKTYLALGDSYTIGEAVPQAESFPFQLRALLNQQGVRVDAPTVVATTGWTTDELITAIDQSGLVGKQYNFVTLLVGVNDQYRGMSQDNYRIKFKHVLDMAIQFVGGNPKHVFVLSIPDYGVTPFAKGQNAAIGPQIDQFNAINRSISETEAVNYLDITGISREAATESDLIASDGLHPSGKMYNLWVQRLAPMVENILLK